MANANDVRIINSDIVTAFMPNTVGTKVLDAERFLEVAKQAIAGFDFTSGRVPGQGFISCPDAVPFVSAGVGKRTQDATDYLPVFYRGRVDLFLRRSRASAVEGCALVVYTKQAYLEDPDIRSNAERRARIEESDCTHVLVAVLAFAGPKAPLSPFRLVYNLAGGNNEATEWSVEDIRAKAREALDYDTEWCVVAD